LESLCLSSCEQDSGIGSHGATWAPPTFPLSRSGSDSHLIYPPSWAARRARRLQGTWLGGSLRAGGTEAVGYAWQLWPVARHLIVSSTRLRCARLRRGHSTRPWHVIEGLRVCAVGQRQCRPERGVVTTARPSAERLQSIPARPACAGGGHCATARAPTESAACACGVRSISRVDTTGCASGAGPAAAGTGVRHAES